MGLVFYQPVNASNLNMNMTSQKMNNFIMANIPMVVNDNIDFDNKKWFISPEIAALNQMQKK